MKSITTPLLSLAMTIIAVHDHQCSAFTTTTPALPSSLSTSRTPSKLNMGMFDSLVENFLPGTPEEREVIKKAKDKAKRLEIEEQLRLQKEIVDRRRSPEKMDEYHALKQQRRESRMEGDNEGAEQLAAKIFENVDDTQQTVSFGAAAAADSTTSSEAEDEVDLKSKEAQDLAKKYKLM